MSEKVVVIGSNSFSGSHFVDFALDQGLEVAGISRSVEPDPVFLPYKNKKGTRFKFHRLDLNHDLDAIMGIIDDMRPDFVVNFAAQSMVGESWDHPEHWFQTNVVANIKLHDRLRKCAYLKKYVHISTPEVYGSCEGLVKENTSYNPSTPYAVSRAAADMSLMSFYKAYNFPVVFTRAANVYGPGQQLYRIIPKTILSVFMKRKIPLHGGGASVRSFIHIRDVADGTLKAARKGEPGDIFHFSTPSNISIRNLVEMITKEMKVNFKDFVEVAEERPGKDAAYLLDSSKAISELQWSPKIKLEEGIRETIKWVKDNLDNLKEQPSSYIHKP
jgi:dTDP-glucose 4,6-dehydratase